MNDILDLTIAIPVKNEEVNLRGCLEAIGKSFAKHIIIIDSGSTDRTIDIAEEFGAEVVRFDWNGRYPKKRNWYLKNHTPSTKWVFFLDADEYLTDLFKNETREALNSGDDAVAYWLNYTIFFMGKNLKGGYPLKKLALFQVGAGEYERIDEEQWSKLDMEIHEHPVIVGKQKSIASKINHQDFRGVSHYVIKHNEYANWEASRFVKVMHDEKAKKSWTKKQRIKYSLIKSVWIGPLYFLASFFLYRGFLDGQRGLAFSILKMSYFNQIYCKIKELSN